MIAYAPSLDSRVYALYWNGVSYTCGAPAPEAEFYYWSDGSSTWTDISATLPDVPAVCLVGNDPFACQTGYDLVVAVKPDDAATVFIGGTNAYRSTDIGATWTRIGGYASPADYSLYASSHPDIHAFAFKPTSSTTMLCGNDGGIQRTTDNLAGTVAWTQINTGYRTHQYYYVDVDPRVANDKVIGGTQDNGSNRNGETGTAGTSFEMVYGGDGVSVGLSGSTTWEYVGSQLGNIRRRSAATPLEVTTNIRPTAAVASGLFVTLFKLDPDNTEILYYANNNELYRTTSASTVAPGSGWTSMTGIATSVGGANDITAIAVTRGTYSAATASLFMGTSNGKVYRMNDPTSVAAETASPVDITGGSFPASAYISSIAVNPRNDDTVLVTFSSYAVSSAWWTGNANSATPTWTAVEGSLSLPSYRSSAIHAVPNSPEVHYFVGTSVGLYRVVGLPGTTTWTQEGAGSIGNAVVSSMSFRPGDGKLLAGTHGYGMWYTMLSLSPLPVELTEFKGSLQNNKTALLQWTTSSENNSKHFELERSFDGINYRTITSVAAAGNSSSTRQYSYVDREPLTENNYYRLRSVDMDGNSKLSTVVLLKLPGAQQDIQVLGNPFKNKIVIRFVKPPEAKGELRLNDMTGRLVARRAIGPGEQQMEFAISGTAAAGTYVLQAVINGKAYTTKVLKE